MGDTVETTIGLERALYNVAKREAPDTIVFVYRRDVDFGYATYDADARLVATVLTSDKPGPG